MGAPDLRRPEKTRVLPSYMYDEPDREGDRAHRLDTTWTDAELDAHDRYEETRRRIEDEPC